MKKLFAYALLLAFIILWNQSASAQQNVTKQECENTSPIGSTYYFDAKNDDAKTLADVARKRLGDASKYQNIIDTTRARHDHDSPKIFPPLAPDGNNLANGDCLAIPPRDDFGVKPNLVESITLDGSDTVFPVFQAYIKANFEQLARQVGSAISINVDFNDSTTGLQELCTQNPTINIAMASRKIDTAGQDLQCTGKNIIGFTVGSDAIVLIANINNPKINNSLTFADAGQLLVGSNLGPDLTRYYPANDSGGHTGTAYVLASIFSQQLNMTPQNFLNAMYGQPNKVLHFTNYETIVDDINADVSGFGFVPYSSVHFSHHTPAKTNLQIIQLPCLPGRLKPNQNCPAQPPVISDQTVSTGQYPLSRPVFIYVHASELHRNEALQGFLSFSLDDRTLPAAQQTAGLFSYPVPKSPEECLQAFIKSDASNLTLDPSCN